MNDKWIQGKSLIDLQASVNQEVIRPGAMVVDLMEDKEWSNDALNDINPVEVREQI